MSIPVEELHPQVVAMLEEGEGAAVVERDPALLRADYEALTPEQCGPGEPVATVRDLAEPVPMRVYEPDDAHGTVVFLHGGGWVVGSLDSHDALARALANASGARVVLPDYRLAPEHPYPAALEDAEAALAFARTFGDPVAVAGDSAGGGLAAVLARRHRDLRLQALVYPVLDAGMATASYERYAEGYRLTAEDMAWFFETYGGDPDDPDVSPLRARDLAGLPPASITLASHDVLRDEGCAYAERLRAANVDVSVTVVDGMVHGFIRWLAKVDAARAAVTELGGALRAALRE
ncbi:MAG TPA: alpha/beta hydrolase [Capillimicrobium sp.]|nr:alpha/beta hydrolase [Capillimicrobium sp.]